MVSYLLRNVVFAFLPPVESVESSGEAQVFHHFTSHHHHHHVVSTLPDHGVHDYHIGNDSNYDVMVMLGFLVNLEHF